MVKFTSYAAAVGFAITIILGLSAPPEIYGCIVSLIAVAVQRLA